VGAGTWVCRGNGGGGDRQVPGQGGAVRLELGAQQ